MAQARMIENRKAQQGNGGVMTEQLYTIPEAAEAVRMSDRWIRLKLQHREIRYVKLGASVRIPKSEIDRLIDENTVEPGELSSE